MKINLYLEKTFVGHVQKSMGTLLKEKLKDLGTEVTKNV